MDRRHFLTLIPVAASPFVLAACDNSGSNNQADPEPEAETPAPVEEQPAEEPAMEEMEAEPAPQEEPAPEEEATGGTVHEVSIANFAFAPASLTVAVGDTVRFTNNDSAPHTATADGGAFDTGRLSGGDVGEIVITEAGSYPYHCEIHSSMKGTITAE
ncbi:cupredoxin domain-containing protein [Cucumibacter marinus]|uniref:cupredoxin domain-containing protein n=1 Tax=Cucumibacter marinus TaxID=1121252 RepID=UPI00042A72CC|nr:cupredoxin family copper-binding protein [Cucumibacter marinus]